MTTLVTVGTTAFDPLIEAVDQGPHAADAFLQIADGDYEPLHARWGRFVDDLDSRIAQAAIVVCHAGAGTVFGLLQRGVVPVVVPNTVRRDKHQIELAGWLKTHRFAIVADGPADVNRCVSEFASLSVDCLPFDTPRFFYADQLNELVCRSL